eukprot:3410410-Pleurochrysis_carterae.AAC.1
MCAAGVARSALASAALVSRGSASLVLRGAFSMQAAGIHTGLNYQERPPSGRRTGRNIGEHANMAHDLQDVHVLTDIDIGDARGIAAKLDKEGFELRAATSGCEDFQNETAIANFYAATSDVVKACSGADRVAVFDHTLRKSGVSDLNSLDGKSAAGAVVRVHCDYTPSSGPVRLAALAEGGQVDLPKAPSRFAFINVWRNIDREHPVLTNPLAVCAADSVDLSDAWPYLMMYEKRTGALVLLGAGPIQALSWCLQEGSCCAQTTGVKQRH